VAICLRLGDGRHSVLSRYRTLADVVNISSSCRLNCMRYHLKQLIYSYRKRIATPSYCHRSVQCDLLYRQRRKQSDDPSDCRAALTTSTGIKLSEMDEGVRLLKQTGV